VRIVFFGTPEFACPSLQALVDAGHDIALVLSRPDRPAGRKMLLETPPVVKLANNLGLRVDQPEKLGTDEVYERLRGLNPDVCAVVAFGRLISPRLLRLPKHGFVNVHPSLLPRYRGPSPIEWAILSGDDQTGVSTMLLDEGLDTGPILLQRSTPIGRQERAFELEQRLAQLGALLLVETMAGLAGGTIIAEVQDSTQATMSAKLDRHMGRVDWALPADDLARRCRAFDPFPGLYANFRGARVKIHGVEVLAVELGNEKPGAILFVSSAGIAVRCGDSSAALLTELQREGKRRLPADAFVIGERVAPGEQFH
jgi:methionyl-tRNA formyltransferase